MPSSIVHARGVGVAGHEQHPQGKPVAARHLGQVAAVQPRQADVALDDLGHQPLVGLAQGGGPLGDLPLQRLPARDRVSRASTISWMSVQVPTHCWVRPSSSRMATPRVLNQRKARRP